MRTKLPPIRKKSAKLDTAVLGKKVKMESSDLNSVLSPSTSAGKQMPESGATSPLELTLQENTGTPFSRHSELGGSNSVKQARVLFTQTTPSKVYNEGAPVISLADGKHISPTQNSNPTTPKPATPKLTKAEREAMKEEVRAKREAEKLKREQEKLRKDQEKKERREKREQELRERQEKKEKEELEKKERKEKKEADRRKKEDERKKQEEERKKTEMEREMAKEEKTRKEKERFIGFFSKLPKEPPVRKSDVFTVLTPFSVRPDMILAKRPHPPLSSTAEFDSFLLSQDYKGSSYLAECKGHRLSATNTQQNEVIVIADEEDDDVIIASPPSPHPPMKRKMKLLQFHKNYRPAYFGTWSKNSRHVSPRNPFKMDKGVFDYEVDSDDEWEEDEPGESVSDSGADSGGESAGEGDEDGFFVPHGYLSEDEGEYSDGGGEDTGNEARKQKQLAKAKAWEAEFSRKCQQLKPKLVGPVWYTRSAEDSREMTKDEVFLCQFEALALVDVPISIGEPSSSSQPGTTSHSTGGEGTKRAVPEEAMPDLIRLVHSSSMGLVRLIKTFRTHWGAKMALGGSIKATPTDTPTSEDFEKESGISKRQLEFKIQSMAVKEVRHPYTRPRWFVHDNVCKKYSLDPSNLTPLVLHASPSVAKQKPHGKAPSPETPSLVKKGLKRKTDGIQTVKSLFETVAKTPPIGEQPNGKKVKLEPKCVAPQTTPTRPRPHLITTLLSQSSPPVAKKARLESDWSDPQQLAKFAAQYIPQIIPANQNAASILTNQNAASMLTNENSASTLAHKTSDYILLLMPPHGNTLHERSTNTQF